jgi:hypothetical protein
MQTIGPDRPAQSASAPHLPHEFAVEHTGVVLAQSALATHWTQAPVGAQTGIAVLFAAQAPTPAGAMAQGTQAPAVPQNGFVAEWQSASAPHSTQAPVDAQAGRAALLAAHAPAPAGAMAQGTQAPAVPQNGFVAERQSASAPHSTHAPVDAQAGRAALLAAHALAPAGAMAQGTQAPVVPQNGFVAEWQSASAPHSTQAPVDAQAGRAALLAAHALAPAGAMAQGTHAPAVPQNGFVAEWQSASVPHSTQAPLVPQIGLLGSCPAQTPAPAAAQETHAAAGEQKALVGS